MTSTKLDPRLRYLHEQSATTQPAFAESIRLGAARTVRGGVEVLLRCRKAKGTKTVRSVEKKLTDLGMTILATVDGPEIVVSGLLPLDRLDDLVALDWVEVIEASRQLFSDLDLSGVDVGVRALQTVPPTVRGTNVLVGVVDGGIDFTHDDFRHLDGTSRIRFL